jgi:hypothetical protein
VLVKIGGPFKNMKVREAAERGLICESNNLRIGSGVKKDRNTTPRA